MIVGICGLIGSGKNTVADILVSEYGYKRIAYADALKDAVSVVFGWDRNMIEGSTDESRQWREQPDEYWSSEMGKEITPRYVLQTFGTESMRNIFHEDIWVSTVKKKILSEPETNWVVTDVRFENEMGMLQSLGGELWQVRRGELPEWWETALKTNTCDIDNEWILLDNMEHMESAYPTIHSSEWKWIFPDDYFDVIIANDGPLDELQRVVKSLVPGHRSAMANLAS